MMKRTFRRLTAVLLTLCMALSLLPVSAFAEGETQTDTVVSQPEQIAGITLTAEATQWPEGEEKPAALTVVAANQYPLLENRIYLELHGTPNTSYICEYSCGEERYTTQDYADEQGNARFDCYLSNVTAGSLPVQLEFSVDTDNDGTLEYVFAPVMLNTYLAEELPPLTMADMENETAILSTRENNPYLDLYLPKGMIPENADLELRLYGHQDGLLYARTDTDTGNEPEVYPNWMQDARYEQIFRDYYQQVECTNLYGNLFVGRALKDTQGYDLKVFSGKEVLATLENLVEVSSLPVTELYEYSQLGVNQEGKSTAYIQLALSNGNIDDYKVSVYDADHVLMGTSNTYRVSYANAQETRADFVVSLNKPLQADGTYVARLESDTEFTGDREVEFYTNSGKRSTQMVFASSYYANIVLQTVGFDPERTYRAELNQSGSLLATLMTQCDENGVFDLEFVDANGEPMRLTPEESYNVSLRENRNGQWQYAANDGAWFRGAEPVQEEGGEGGETSGNPEEYAYLQVEENGRVGFWVRLLDETFGQLDVSKLGLRLHSLANESVLVKLDQRDSWAEENIPMHGYECYGPIPSGWENIYVYGELLYDDQPLTDAETGENLLYDGYPEFLTTEMAVGTHIGEANGLWYTTGLYIRNAKEQDVRVELFRFGNTGVEPDNAFVVSAKDDYHFTTLPDLVSERMGPYSMQTRVNGKLTSGNSSYDYIATESAISSAAGTTYSLSAQSAEHGKVQLIDPATGKEVTSAKALSEVYVRLVAEDGYQPKPGSVQVNGQSIFGRAIRVNGNCTVSAAFEEIPAVRYDIRARNTSSNGTYSVQETAAAGEKVIVSVNPNEGYTVNLDQSYIYYYAPDYTRVTLQQDEAGHYYFIMPESGVNLYMYFRRIYTPSMRLYFNNSYGTGSALSKLVTFTKADGTAISHDEQVTEGTVINVQAQLHPEVDGVRYDFGSVELSYWDSTTGEEKRVPVELDENGIGSFRAPQVSSFSVYTTYIPYKQFTVTANGAFELEFESGSGAYYPNETVRFRMKWNAGYEQNGEPHYYDFSTYETVCPKLDEDGWYTFTMPMVDLQISCDYRGLNQFTLYNANIYSSQASVYVNGSSSPLDVSVYYGKGVYENSEVTVRIEPVSGNRVKEGSVYCEESVSGNRVEVTRGEDGLYRFTMPSADTKLYAEIEQIPMYYVESAWNTSCEFVGGRQTYEEGETVTVQFTGPEGYVMDAGYPRLISQDNYGVLNVQMTPLGDNRYSFPMPAQNCYVEAQFVETPRYSAQPMPSGNSISVGWYELNGRTAFEEGETATFVFSISSDYVMAPGYPKVVSQQSGQELNVTVTSLGNGTYSFPVPAENCYLQYEVKQGTRYNVGVATSGGEGNVQPSEFNPVAGKTVTVNAWNYARGGWVNLTCVTASGAEVALTYDASTRQYSFIMPEENVTLRAEFVQEREVPGGVVTDLDSLLAALGGPACVEVSSGTDDITRLNATLRGNLKLKTTLDIRSGNVTLSLNGYSVSYDGAADSPALRVGANVTRFDLNGSLWMATGVPQVGRITSNGPTVEVADGACNGQYLNISGGWYTSAQNAALKIGGTTAVVSLSGSPVYANTDSADHYAVELTGKLEKGWFGNLLAWSDSGKSIRLPEGDSLTNYLTYADDSGMTATMDAVEVFAIDGDITPVMDIDIFMGMNVPGWTGKSLPESALSASAYEKALFLTRPYTVTFTKDTEKAGELCGSLTLPAQKQANGLWLDFSVEPKFGNSVELVQYFPTYNDTQRYEIWKDKTTGLYGFTMPNYDIKLDVLVKEIPETQMLDKDTFLAGQECWNFNLKVAGDNLDDNTGFVKVTVLDQEGNVVDRQESHWSYTYMTYFQPGLATGRYKVYVTVGDQWNQRDLGWQWIRVIDGVSYGCNMDGRSQLTTETRFFDVAAWVETAATQLPGDLRLEVVDAATQQVLATSTDYSIRIHGGDTAGSGTADKDVGIDKFYSCTNLCFHVELPHRLTDGSNVELRLASERTDFVCNWVSSYYVSSYSYIDNGKMDMTTRIWTATAECVPQGSFWAYSDSNPGVTYPVLVENGVMTVDFSQNWPFSETTSYLWMYVDFGGDFGSRGFSVSVPTQNGSQPYYEMTLDGAYSFHDTLAGNYSAEYLMSLRDVGETLTVRLQGTSGSGTYRLYRYDPYMGNVELASGDIDDLASFQVPVKDLVTAEQVYSVQVNGASGQYLRQCSFYVTALPTVIADDKHSTDDTMVLRLLNVDAAQLAKLHLGYTSSEEGRVELPFTDNGDGTVTLDLRELPVGVYRLWGRIKSETKQDVQVGRYTTLEKLPQRQQVTVQVSDPVTSNHVTTATVTYSGTPAGSVTMSVYEAEYIDEYQQALTFVKNVNIGSKTYTINSKTLGLNGLYALYFTDESGVCLGAVMMQMGAPVHTVTFRDGRDNSLLCTVRVAEGQAVQMPAVPAKVGFSFRGWFDGPDDKGEHALADLSSVMEDCTVYAHYARNKYEVVFADWDGTTLCTQDVKYANWPELDSVPDPSERAGYVFVDWDLSALEKNGVTCNMVIYPIFEKAEITVKLELLGGVLPEDQAAEFAVTNGQPAFGNDSIPSPTREGYVFAGWQTDLTSGVPYKNEALRQDTVLYAKWQKAPRAITVESEDVIVKMPDSAVPGDTVMVILDVPYGMSVESVVLTTYGGSSTLLTVRTSAGGLHETSFVMPDADVTLTVTAAENDGALTICFPNYIPETTTVICYDPYFQDVFGRYDVSWDSESGEYVYYMSGLPKGTYYVTVMDGSFTQTQTVILSDKETVTFDLAQPGTYTGTVSPAEGRELPNYLWVYFYDDNGYYVTGTWINEDGSFQVDSLPMGKYTVEVWGSHAYALENNTVDIDGTTGALSLTLLPTADLTVTLNTASQLGKYAYLMLEKKTSNGWEYVTSGFGSSENGTTYLFEDVVSAAEEQFRVTLTDLTRNYYSGSVRFDSEPVTVTATEEELASGSLNASLSYSLPSGTLSDLSGEGNLVAANRTDVNPGDVVDVVIRFDSGETLVSPTFTFGPHSGLTRMDEQPLTAKDAASGSFHTTFRVDEDAKGILELPVYATLDGDPVRFGTVNLTVNKVTLTAPAQVMEDESFTVYGEAPEGSVVNIRNSADQVLATVPVTGRFYSVELTLTGDAVLTAEVNGLRSESVSVSVTSEPVTVDAVWYGDTYYKTEAAFNSRLNAYSFWQYVDMQLEGFDLPIHTRFTNPGRVKSVTYHFCGVDARAVLDKTDGSWQAVFAQGTWGGSGLKTLTATVETVDGEMLEMTIAVVNLLIDPSGVVTDESGKPLEGVTVICQVWDETHGAWVDFDAESVGQVNPQITDSEGRYGWFVSEGKYRILASKEGYADYDSLLDSNPNNSSIIIPPPRNDVNFVMHALNSTYHVLQGTVENAQVTVEKAEAKGGETVCLTVTADDKFTVKSVSVRTVSGKNVEVSGDGTFTMPHEDVVYSVSAEPASKPALGPVMTAEVVDGKLTVSVENLKLEYAKVMVAFYDTDGRMMGVRMNVGTEVAVISGAAKARVFLLNDNLPVMQSKEVPL